MRRSAIAGAALVGLATSQAAAQDVWRPIGTYDASPTVVAPSDPNLPQYRVPAGNTNFDGVVRIIMNQTGGSFVCSGSLLAGTGGTGILSAGHCFTNAAGVNVTLSTTIEVRSPQTGELLQSVTAPGSAISIKPGYTGAVIDQRDVAFVRLPTALTTAGLGYSLYDGPATIMGQNIFLAGYGQTGNGTTGATGGAQTWMRYGLNRFDTSCLNLSTAATNCAGTLPGNPSTALNTFGGVLLGDFDDPTGVFNNANSLTCFRFGTCETGIISPLPGEVGIGGGDSGSAAFLASTQAVLGVASFGSRRVDISPVPPFGAFGTAFGYACVGRIAGNTVCIENNDWVRGFLTPVSTVPEPSTYALMATGLAGLLVAARRRRSAK